MGAASLDNESLRTQQSMDPVGSHSSGATISSATLLSPQAGSTRLLIQALTQNVRYTLDGTVPTATKGFQLKAGDAPRLIQLGGDTVLNVIQETATADLELQWLK